MKNILFQISFFFTALNANAQINENHSFADEIRLSFNYDSLSLISCDHAPVGIYAIFFKVSQKGFLNDFAYTNDSLKSLNYLFIDAIKKTNTKILLPSQLKEGEYLQLIYFSNSLSCKPQYAKALNVNMQPDSVLFSSKKINQEVIKILSDQLISIQNSLVEVNKGKFLNKSLNVLPIAFINNDDPNSKNGRGFQNDIKKFSGDTKEIEDKIESKKRQKDKPTPSL